MKYDHLWMIGIAGFVAIPTILWLYQRHSRHARIGYRGRANYIANSPVYGHQYPPLHPAAAQALMDAGRHNNISNSLVLPTTSWGGPVSMTKKVHEIRGVTSKKHPTDTDPYDIGAPVPLPPLHVDVGPWYMHQNRIAKEIRNNAMVYSMSR